MCMSLGMTCCMNHFQKHKIGSILVIDQLSGLQNLPEVSFLDKNVSNMKLYYILINKNKLVVKLCTDNSQTNTMKFPLFL